MGSGISKALTKQTAHLCLDMQNIFMPGGLWATPWMPNVIPVVSEIADRHAARTIFTRFITPESEKEVMGQWTKYYSHWPEALRPQLPKDALCLVAELARHIPPARVIDKMHFSAFAGSSLMSTLTEISTDALVVTGAETDVCVLATILHAVDLGLRVIVVQDAICSSSDEGHDALMKVFHGRYTHQIETAVAEEVLSVWPLK